MRLRPLRRSYKASRLLVTHEAPKTSSARSNSFRQVRERSKCPRCEQEKPLKV